MDVKNECSVEGRHYFNMVVTGDRWLLSFGNVASTSKKLNFEFHLMILNLKWI